LSIDGDLFKHSQQLRWIFFGSSPTQHFGYNLLTSLQHLEVVDFYEIACMINIFANTTEAIQEVNRILPIQCPPLTVESTTLSTTTSTTAPDFCPASCMDEIKENENEIQIVRNRQNGLNSEFEEKLRQQTDETNSLKQLTKGHTDKIEQNQKEIQDLGQQQSGLKSQFEVEMNRQSNEIDELKRQMRELMASPCTCMV
jgi:vacuolar-type H+-ATPase subunit I/STV1